MKAWLAETWAGFTFGGKVWAVLIAIAIGWFFVDGLLNKPKTLEADKVASDTSTTPAAQNVRPPSAANTKKPPTKEDIETTIAFRIAKALKASMKNPASFKLETALVFPGGSTCYEYRATNSFNAVVPGRAVFDMKAEKLYSEQDGESFRKAWNSICTKKGGRNIAPGLEWLL